MTLTILPETRWNYALQFIVSYEPSAGKWWVCLASCEGKRDVGCVLLTNKNAVTGGWFLSGKVPEPKNIGD